MADYNRFDVVQQDGVTVATLRDDRLSDLVVQNELDQELTKLISENQPIQLVIVFKSVMFCASGAINAFLQARKRILADGGQLALCEMTKPVRDAFRILNLEGTVFQIHNTRDEAIKAF